MISRRSFLGQAAATGLIAASQASAATSSHAHLEAALLDLHRTPDAVTAFAGLSDSITLPRSGERFAGKDVIVSVDITNDVRATESHIRLAAPTTAVTHIRLRWSSKVSPTLQCLGDHWERSYGDLAWRGITPERMMPWYFATYDGSTLHAYGVKTGAGSLCFWQMDPEGVSLWLDVSNGGDGVVLGTRELVAAAIVTRKGVAGEPPVAALRAFCQQMCPTPRLPEYAVYGSNDWYTAYGNNSQEMLLQIADLTAEISQGQSVRPFTVVDMGWKENSPAFPSMAGYAEQVRKRGVRPGIWIRPLEAAAGTSGTLLLPDKRYGARTERFRELAYDPTIPEGLAMVQQKIKQLADWNFDLVKHHFSTYDLLGQWGFEMGAQPSIPGWHFHDRSRTNAEIILDFYKFLRETLGHNIQILGCNTIGHLGAGIFELQRTGDDTSGRIWERTRRMGLNTLAYRLPQHRTFFHLDADCVGITKAIPWELNRQWLHVVARSGTALFVSPEDGAVGPDQRAALKEAFAMVTSPNATAHPVDFFHDTTPETWSAGNRIVKQYQWCATDGAWPFVV
jgi:alpha-galactosidase